MGMGWTDGRIDGHRIRLDAAPGYTAVVSLRRPGGYVLLLLLLLRWYSDTWYVIRGT